ncbi:MAG: hypothetical protein COA73_14410 [Candidatus Hydrogenedentota bacterium]|nr:MAG: hypothetical protein COA73_14410 [Candidatus Hydrogenedentota bacterium]
MEHSNRRYTEEEVSEAIRRSLSRGSGTRDTISHDELLDIAQSSGITRSELESSLEYQESRSELEAAKAHWVKRRRQDFYSNLRSYVIVNGVLLLMNLVTSPRYIWAIWPILGWGIGLLFHASDTFFVSEEKIERGARKILKKQQRYREKIIEDIY